MGTASMGMASEEVDGDDRDDAQAVRSYLGDHGIAVRRDVCAEALGDVLLDHYEQLRGHDFVLMLGCALTRTFEKLARAYCRRELLLLDPLLIAEDAVVRVLLETVRGVRRPPLAAHVDRYIEESARVCVGDPVVYLFQPADDPTSEHAGSFLFLHHACGIVNHMSSAHRRMAWLAWVDGRPLNEIERLTGVPLERVEFFLTHLLEQAKDRMASESWDPRFDSDGDREEGADEDE